MVTTITVETQHCVLRRTLYGPVSDERYERELKDARHRAEQLVPYQKPVRRETPLDAYGPVQDDGDYEE